MNAYDKEGIKESKKEIVIEMLKDKVDIEIICKYSNLNIEDVKNIMKSLEEK